MPKDSYESQVARGMNPAGGPDKSAAEVAKAQGERVWNQWEDDTAKELQEDAADSAIAEHGLDQPINPPYVAPVETKAKAKAKTQTAKKK